MKKLMIALAVATCAVAANAASFKWTASGMTAAAKTINSKAGTALYSGTTAFTLYLFDASATSQDQLLTGLRGASAITDFKSVTSQTLANNSQITAQEFTYGSVGTKYNFYFAVINGDDVFISDSAAASGQSSDVSSVMFGGLGTATKNAFADTSATFASNGAGWYAVPEPTSGLLLLLGFAGLALKRKRA